MTFYETEYTDEEKHRNIFDETHSLDFRCSQCQTFETLAKFSLERKNREFELMRVEV